MALLALPRILVILGRQHIGLTLLTMGVCIPAYRGKWDKTPKLVEKNQLRLAGRARFYSNSKSEYRNPKQ